MKRTYREGRSRGVALARAARRAYRGRVDDDTETCPRCDGEGLVAARGASVMVDQGEDPPMHPCPVCGGKGEVPATDT